MRHRHNIPRWMESNSIGVGHSGGSASSPWAVRKRKSSLRWTRVNVYLGQLNHFVSKWARTYLVVARLIKATKGTAHWESKRDYQSQSVSQSQRTHSILKWNRMRGGVGGGGVWALNGNPQSWARLIILFYFNLGAELRGIKLNEWMDDWKMWANQLSK